MRLVTDHQALPHPLGSMVCRQSRTIAVSAVIVFAAITGTLAWAVQTGRLPAFLWISVALMALIFIPISYSQMKKCLRRSNWTLRIDQRSVLIRFRSPFRPSRPDEIVAVELAFAEIASARRRTVHHRSDGPNDTQWKDVGVVFTLAEPLPDLREALDVDRAANTYEGGKRIRTRTRHYPCTLMDDRTLFVHLTGKHDFNRPRVARVLARLGEFVEIGEPVFIDRKAERDAAKRGDDANEALETEILELAASGSTIAAVRLVRKRYGYSLTEAKKLVDGLVGDTPDTPSLKEQRDQSRRPA